MGGHQTDATPSCVVNYGAVQLRRNEVNCLCAAHARAGASFNLPPCQQLNHPFGRIEFLASDAPLIFVPLHGTMRKRQFQFLPSTLKEIS
ncbi:MAG TPA: hypothetical protein VIU93_07715, partial [Gallionellaceae bacterium]